MYICLAYVGVRVVNKSCRVVISLSLILISQRSHCACHTQNSVATQPPYARLWNMTHCNGALFYTGNITQWHRAIWGHGDIALSQDDAMRTSPPVTEHRPQSSDAIGTSPLSQGYLMQWGHRPLLQGHLIQWGHHPPSHSSLMHLVHRQLSHGHLM